MQYLGKNSISVEEYIKGVLAGDSVMLGRALSLVESDLESDLEAATEILEGVMAQAGKSVRVGITGAPGVGKSTFIEALGLYLLDKGHKVAVLTVDPTSQRSRGSILGDKTRMEQLSKSHLAFIRPSASGDSLGGVAHHTRESILLCEAAGYDVILIETVGVGQSETVVRDMVDCFLLLMIAGAGDELQGIKKGIIEMADALIITKADGENVAKAREAQAIFKGALHLLSGTDTYWRPKVLTCSSQKPMGITEVWDTVLEHREALLQIGQLEKQRQSQRLKWMQDCIRWGIEVHLKGATQQVNMDALREQVSRGEMLPGRAAAKVLNLINK